LDGRTRTWLGFCGAINSQITPRLAFDVRPRPQRAAGAGQPSGRSALRASHASRAARGRTARAVSYAAPRMAHVGRCMLRRHVASWHTQIAGFLSASFGDQAARQAPIPAHGPDVGCGACNCRPFRAQSARGAAPHGATGRCGRSRACSTARKCCRKSSAAPSGTPPRWTIPPRRPSQPRASPSTTRNAPRSAAVSLSSVPARRCRHARLLRVIPLAASTARREGIVPGRSARSSLRRRARHRARPKTLRGRRRASRRSAGVAEEDVLPADPFFAVDAPVTMGARAHGTSQRAVLHFSAAVAALPRGTAARLHAPTPFAVRGMP
jgi:hypothetical protein